MISILPASLLAIVAQAGPASLADQLLREDPSSLARAVAEQGDAKRGAGVFYRPHLACTTCHGDPGSAAPTLGPDLTRLGPEATDAYLVESILEPSKAIKQGFGSVSVATADGKTLTGLLVEDGPDRVVVRDPGQGGKLVTIEAKEVEQKTVGGPSIMPTGLANTLNSRQEFLDLVRYLRAIAEKGPEMARVLRPDPSSLVARVADYERDIDHAGLIAGLNRGSFDRGEAIYGRVCANCHGTRDRPGSMPTSTRFGTGVFKNGNDPHSLYRTLTRGFGQMPAQGWMVPTQKYDVIHYIREAFLKADNPSEYRPADRSYLAVLPKGTSRGPSPSTVEPWSAMDYGPTLLATIEVGRSSGRPIIAYKGVAARLDPGPGGIARGNAFAVYDHDTMQLQAFWTGPGFIDWRGINFDGRHEVHPRAVGTVRLLNPVGPAWADPTTGSFDDPRIRGRDGLPYGPLPRPWLRYRGLDHRGGRAILVYDIGAVEVRDSPSVEPVDGLPALARTLEVGPSPRELVLQVGPTGNAVALVGTAGRLVEESGSTRLHLPPSAGVRVLKLLISDGDPQALRRHAEAGSSPPVKLSTPVASVPTRPPLRTRVIRGRDDGPFAVDVLAHPADDPWSSRMRFTGLDFLPGGSMVACDWDGDVWRVDGLDDPSGHLDWTRVASGLFQPLGIKVVGDTCYVSCRDQIVRLSGVGSDGETHFYECFNTDHQVTEHFHEFAMGLQADPSGNLYYAKGARHGKTAVVPQHGTLLRVSKDGTTTDILARGFRAPNGVCLNPDGTFFLTDQEGHWIPKNRINHVRVGGFYGNMWGYHDLTDPSDSAMEPPVCWITNAVDRSPSEVVRVESKRWGRLDGALLCLSYGYGKIFVVPHESIGGRLQGGVAELPVPQFPTGLVRGRFRPGDGALYACGMFAWAGTQDQPGGLYRIRATGKPARLPVGLHARRDGLAITFTDPIDPAAAADPARFEVKAWSLKRSASYGSKHVDERPMLVRSARPEGDGRTVFLEVPSIAPTMGMEVRYRLEGADGLPVVGSIQNTIHALGEPTTR